MGSSSFPNTPKLIKGGIILMDPDSATIKNVIALQYNPDNLSRSLQIQATPGGEDGTHSDALRLRGPAIETIQLSAEIDATDQLENPLSNPNAVQYGIHPQLAQLEMLINPTIETLNADNNLASSGTLEIIPLEQPLTLFVWSQNRIVPVRITEFSVTEEAFDQNLNPIRATVHMGLRVLNIDDLGFDHPGGQIFMTYLGNKERLANLAGGAMLSVLGIGG